MTHLPFYFVYFFQDPGYWVVAKWADEEETELHVTAFIVSMNMNPDPSHFTQNMNDRSIS